MQDWQFTPSTGPLAGDIQTHLRTMLASPVGIPLQWFQLFFRGIPNALT
jgi:hypothetical protein